MTSTHRPSSVLLHSYQFLKKLLNKAYWEKQRVTKSKLKPEILYLNSRNLRKTQNNEAHKLHKAGNNKYSRKQNLNIALFWAITVPLQQENENLSCTTNWAVSKCHSHISTSAFHTNKIYACFNTNSRTTHSNPLTQPTINV